MESLISHPIRSFSG